MKDIVKIICQNNKSQQFVLIKVNDVQTLLKLKKDIEASHVTIRSKGISHGGYFEKKYSDVCTFKNTGDTTKRGLLVKPKKMIEVLENE